MKKFLVVGAAVLAAGALALAGVAQADSDNAAVIINDQGCALLDGDGGFALADSDHAVINHSGGVFICKASDVANSTGQAVIWNFENTAFLCGTPAGTTDKWTETVSASGNATLRCHVNGPDA